MKTVRFRAYEGGCVPSEPGHDVGEYVPAKFAQALLDATRELLDATSELLAAIDGIGNAQIRVVDAMKAAHAAAAAIQGDPAPHVHTRDCYDDPGPGHGPPFLICDMG